MAVSPIVLVTGCSKGGIGFALCEEFASHGCKVYATARRLQAMDDFKHKGIQKLPMDVTNEESIHQVISKIIDTDGRIDIVVNNAGVICPGPVIDVSMDVIRSAFETNTFGPIRVAKRVVPHMVEHGSGLFVNIGSVVGETATPWNGIYSGTKAAFHLINDSLAYECKALNKDIKVMLVVTGAVKSNVSANSVVNLPENSLYKSFIDVIMRRAHSSQTGDVMSAKDYAREVVAKALSKNPPLSIMLGGKTRLFAILKWLPKALVFWLMFRSWRK